MTVPSHDDEVFRQIVAGFTTETDDPVPRWPVSEDVSDDKPTAEREEPRELPALPEASGLPGWVEPPALEDEGHYVPPPPPRLPRIRLRTAGGLVLLVAGLAALFAPFRIGLDDSGASLLVGTVFTAAGAMVLIGSLRDAPSDDDGPDDGAVV